MLIRVALRWFLAALRLCLGLLLCYRGIRAHTNAVWEGTVSVTGIDIMCIQARRQQTQTVVPISPKTEIGASETENHEQQPRNLRRARAGSLCVWQRRVRPTTCLAPANDNSQRQNQPRAHARARDQEFTLCVLHVYGFIPRTHRNTLKRAFPIRPFVSSIAHHHSMSGLVLSALIP